MAKKKAFARYANNKLVPASVFIGAKAPAVGVWKEIQYDLCCDGGSGGNCLYGFSVRIVQEEIEYWETFYSNCDIQNINALTNPGDIIGCNVYVDNNSTISMPNGEYFFLQNFEPYVSGFYVVENGIIVNIITA